jgi:chromatin remodeling complex protein RSC6
MLGLFERSCLRLAMAHWLDLLDCMAKKQKTEAKKANAAFLKPVQPDDSLAAIVGSTPLPRTELTKKLWEYIRKHKLQDPKEKRNINADDKLKAIFNGKQKVSMFEMTKLVNEHLL